MENALLIRFGGLGDLLVALPAIRLLRLSFPSARLILSCRKTYGALLREAGVADRIIPEDSPLLLPLFNDFPASSGREVGWLKEFDLIAGWMQGEKAGHLEQILAASNLTAKICIIHSLFAKNEKLSLFFFRKTGEIANVDDSIPFEKCALLPLTVEMRAKGLALRGDEKPAGRYAVVHPGSGGAAKQWPAARFMAIIERLGENAVGGALITGEAEVKWEAELERISLPPGWKRHHKPDLTALAGLLSESSLYLGNDSGVTHLAAACGANVVAIFLEDLADSWRPYGRVHLHRAARLDEIGVDSVWKTISELLRL
ncbi:MAG: glycosyltransferase family 9 protein [Acidobacteriota bacterium]